MTLFVIGSSSLGNGYILESENCILILELGCKWKDYQKALGYHYSKIVGCLVTHKHNDHSLSIKDANRCGIEVYSCQDVADKHNGVAVLEERQPYQIGEFVVTAYKSYHDVECYCFVIEHPEMGKIFFATDTYQLPYKFRGLNHILIEANYSQDVQIDNAVELNQWSSSANNNHFSVEQSVEFVKRHLSVDLQNVVLLHLSSENSDPEMFKKMFKEEIGIEPYVAKKGLILELNKEDF